MGTPFEIASSRSRYFRLLRVVGFLAAETRVFVTGLAAGLAGAETAGFSAGAGSAMCFGLVGVSFFAAGFAAVCLGAGFATVFFFSAGFTSATGLELAAA